MRVTKFAYIINNICSFAERKQEFKNTLRSEDGLNMLAQNLGLKINAAFINMEVLFPIHAILYT